MSENPRILLVDDERLILELMREYFELQGYEVHTASELEEAEAMVTTYPYGAVITDLRLTGVDSVEGLELVRFVRQHSPHARVLLLTGHGTSWCEGESWRRGVDAFLHKPQPLPVLSRTLRGLMEAA